MPREKAVRTIGNGKAPTAKSLGSEADGPLGLTGETFVAKPAKKKSIGGDLGFEATLWSAADQLRGAMDASEYKHPVLGLIFLKYISDAFEEKHAQLGQDADSDPEE